MAAYAALIIFNQTLEEILNPHPQIKSLKDKVSQLLDFLENSSENCNSNITDLEGKMRDAAYEGEDIIESHLLKSTSSFGEMFSSRIPYEGEDIIEPRSSKQILPKSTSSSGKMFCVWIRNLISACHRHEEESHLSTQNLPKSSISSRTIDRDLELEIKKLQKIMEEFELILDSVSKIKDGKVIEPLQPARNSLTAGPSRISFSKKSAMVGLDGDLIQIKDQLTGSSSHLNIISVVGMGGIGKTTLARNLYNDSLIDYHFHIRAWVTVSQDYHLQKILIDLLNSIRHVNSESHDQLSIDQLEENLYKSLKGRKYLIVMDDVWDAKAWDDVKRLFPNDNNGSRIILTTRISEVALYANSFSSIHHMSLLGLEESWNLLREKVFGEECCPSEFEEIGTKIAKKCKGLPLAIVVIGGLLSKGSRTQDYWEYIARNVMSATTGNDDQLMDILSLSYNHLPHHLKACFLYMGVFPEDHEILVSRLIKLWVAEGFLKPHHSKILEEVAKEYLKDLIDRNLIIVHKRNHYGGIKTCIIHDLLRDLCVKKTREDKFLLVLNHNVPDFPEVGYNEYRISIHSSILRIGKHDSRVRSFLYFAESFSKNLSLYFVRFRLLKVLDALAMTFGEFPVEIVKLVNLRYLALKFYLVEIPAAIVKLKKLHTLILTQWENKSCDLPSEIWEMAQLRHLSFKIGSASFDYGVSGSFDYGVRLSMEKFFDRKMVHLYTLSRIENLICRKEMFQIMPNLMKLGISYLYNPHSEWSCSDFSSFVCLHKLETLKLSFDLHVNWESIPMNFAFPLKLKKLTLVNCRISSNNMTIIGSLPDIQVLKLKWHSFEGPVWEPSEGEFLRLKYLLLERIDLEHWKANEMHFPNLEHLHLEDCHELNEIPSAIGNIPTLQMLEVICCNDSIDESVKLIEEEQQSLGNDTLKVHVISTQREKKKWWRRDGSSQ